VVRRERPRQHEDLWNLAIEVGDLEDEEIHLVESRRYLLDKAGNLERERALVDPEKTSHLRRMDAEITDTYRTADKRKNNLPAVRRALRKAQRDWLRLAAQRKVSVRFEPGKMVEFKFDPEPRTSGKHWWFDIKCETLLDLRETFGLRRMPAVQLHLTFAVHEGHENIR